MNIDKITSGLLCVIICLNTSTTITTMDLNFDDQEAVDCISLTSNDIYLEHTNDNETDEYEVDNLELDILTEYEIDLISRVVMAEAEGEPLDGKIYVIDTILNRVDSPYFPDTIHDVIYQAHQFSSMWNGRFDRCDSNNDLNDLIIKECTDRINNDIVFFTADEYGEYGSPSFSVANHYFSTYR